MMIMIIYPMSDPLPVRSHAHKKIGQDTATTVEMPHVWYECEYNETES